MGPFWLSLFGSFFLPRSICYGLNYALPPAPPRMYVEVLTPVSQNVTLFGNKVIAGIIK